MHGFGSATVSMRIRIQHFTKMRVRDPIQCADPEILINADPDPDFAVTPIADCRFF